MMPDDLSTIEIMDLVGVQLAISEASITFGGIRPAWRGHAEFDRKLQPQVFRPNPRGGGQYAEASLVLTFISHAESRHHDVQTTPTALRGYRSRATAWSRKCLAISRN